MPRGWRPGRVRLGRLGGPRARSRPAEGTQAWRLGALPRGTGVGPSPSSQPSGSPPRGLPLMRGETISNQRASQARACSPPCEPEYLLHCGGGFQGSQRLPWGLARSMETAVIHKVF